MIFDKPNIRWFSQALNPRKLLWREDEHDHFFKRLGRYFKNLAATFINLISTWNFGPLRIVFALYRTYGWLQIGWGKEVWFYNKGSGWSFVDYTEAERNWQDGIKRFS